MPDFKNIVKEKLYAQARAELLAEASDKSSLEAYLQNIAANDTLAKEKLRSMGTQDRRNITLGRLGCQSFAIYGMKEGIRGKNCSICGCSLEGNIWDHVISSCKELESEREKLGENVDVSIFYHPALFNELAEYIGKCWKKRKDKNNPLFSNIRVTIQ